MEKHLPRPANISHTHIHLICCSIWRFLKSCRRSSRSRKALIVLFSGLLYLFCLDLWTRSGDEEENLSESRTWSLERVPGSHPSTRSNIIYITLKSKRRKPAVLRATLRPKSRRKKAGNRSRDTSNRRGEETLRLVESTDSWRQVLRPFYKAGPLINNDAGRSIRIYSQTSPAWFSQTDLDTMHFLSKCRISDVEVLEAENAPPVLLFKSSSSEHAGACAGRCGVIKKPEDMSEVFAFHLDRVLGLNRSLVTVSRRFSSLDGKLCPVTLYDPSVVPVPESSPGSLRWSSYQTWLQNRCWQRGVPKPEWSCSSLHHHEWSKVALFDFLLQNHQRLDRNCCGFRPGPQDSCVQLGYYSECSNVDELQLCHIVHRRTAPRRLVYINNNAVFDRDEQNLDFKLLQGITELPDIAVSVLRSQRLRQNLLQSLFMDEEFWEHHGRRGIDTLIDVIERRARILLRYINAHAIDIITMNP